MVHNDCVIVQNINEQTNEIMNEHEKQKKLREL